MTIVPFDRDYVYGNCAAKAVSACFHIEYYDVCNICKGLGFRCDEGITYHQCVKLINFGCNLYGYKYKYYPNLKKIKLKDFLQSRSKGIYLLNQLEHLSYFKNGVLIDSYYSNYLNPEVKFQKLLGYWKIN